MKFRIRVSFLIVLVILQLFLTGCSPREQTTPIQVNLDRNLKIPTDAVKIFPENDITPPITLSSEYSQPVPVPGLVNSAGGEDSPFILSDGKTLFFWFTPDVSKPAQTQLLDGVTGIYMSRFVDGAWAEPERILLQDAGKLAGDGCEFVMGDFIWFCSTREGFEGMNWFKAELINGSWQNWRLEAFDPSFEVGELHISSDGKDLYFASRRPGGMGNMDIWVSHWLNGHWNEPGNIMAVNTQDDEGWPALNPAGDELWFYRNFGIWRSRLMDGIWSTPELMISPLAGEPSIDADGNVYFVHHFFKDNVMLEADIYVAYKIQQ